MIAENGMDFHGSVVTSFWQSIYQPTSSISEEANRGSQVGQVEQERQNRKSEDRGRVKR